VTYDRDSCEFAMLEHLANLPRFRSPSLRARELRLCLCDIAPQRRRRAALRRLLGAGCVLEQDGRVAITPQGEEALAASDAWYRDHPPDRSFVRKAHVSRDLFRAASMTLCAGAGIICLQRDKPELTALRCAMTTKKAPSPEVPSPYLPCTAGECLRRLTEGIWYGAAEVRAFLRATSGGEPVYSSRFCGIVLTAHDLYVLYHTGSRLGFWSEEAEQALYGALEGAFRDYPPYSRPLAGYNRSAGIVAVVIGNGSFMIPPLVTGFARGRVKNRRSLDDANRQAMFKVLCARCGVYERLFFCPMTGEGAAQLALLLSRPPEQLDRASESFLENAPGVHPYGQPPMEEDSSPALCLDAVDLRLLSAARKSRRPLAVYAERRLAAALSRALGDRFACAVDPATMQVIEAPLFDRYGYPRTAGERAAGKAAAGGRVRARAGRGEIRLLERICAGRHAGDLLGQLARQYLQGKHPQEGIRYGAYRI